MTSVTGNYRLWSAVYPETTQPPVTHPEEEGESEA